MAYSAEQLEEIERTIASGQESAAFQDRRLAWRSLQDLFRLREEIKRELGGATAAPQFRPGVYEKGL